MTEPKPNIRPGVRGICRNGFWTPPLEATCSMRWPWEAAGMSWSSSGCYRSDGLIDAFDIIGIVEDLPPVPSSQQKSYWRLLEPGELTEIGDEWFHSEERGWVNVEMTYEVRRNLHRRRVTAPEPQPATCEFCDGSGSVDSGGFTPWGEPISIACVCANPQSPTGGETMHELHRQIIDAQRGKPKGYWVPAEHYVPPSEFEQLKSDAAKWREHVASPQPAPQIPGMPDGWEVDPDNEGFQNTYNCYVQIPIRRIKPPEPVCTWQHGVFRDGWLSQDANNGVMQWSETEPMGYSGVWTIKEGYEVIHINMMLNPPKFRDDLPWDQRCVKVGPEAEKGLKQWTMKTWEWSS